MLKFSAKILVFVCVLFTFSQALAARVASLYDVEIPVVNESTETRKRSFDQGLDEVFIRISGDSVVMDKLKRPSSSRYVKQFSYEPVTASATNADTNKNTNKDGEILTHRLKIHYNGRLMEKYLLDNGFPVWGEYRPKVVVWLVVRDGRNEYVLKSSDQSLLKAATTKALARRGIPVHWPSYDDKDKKALNVADIRGGFKEPVLNASRRYSSGPALTGSMIWNGKQWHSSWSLFVEGEAHHWNLDGVDHKQLINKTVDQAADVLGVVFAVRDAANKPQAVAIQLDIQAVNSIEQYRYVENYLSGLSAVESVKPFKVDGQHAVFEVSLRSNEEDLFSLINNDAQLIQVKAPEIEPHIIAEKKPANESVGEPIVSEPVVDEPIVSEPIVSEPIVNEPGSVIEKDTTSDVVAEATVTKEGATATATVTEAENSDDYLPPLKQMPIYYYRLNRQ